MTGRTIELKVDGAGADAVSRRTIDSAVRARNQFQSQSIHPQPTSV